MPHHAGTRMATMVFNIHWDESSCTPVIKIHRAQHPHARCLYNKVLEETHSFDIYLSQLMKQSMGAKRGCCFVIDGLVMNTGRGGRLARKWGRVRVTEGDLPPSLLPSLAPLLLLQNPLCTYSAIWVSPTPRYHIPWHICLGFLLSRGCSDQQEYILRVFFNPLLFRNQILFIKT